MTYTILSARYANPEHTAAEILTRESAAVMISERDRPEAWAEFKEWEKTNRVAVYIEPLRPPRVQSPAERILIAKGIATEADFDAEVNR